MPELQKLEKQYKDSRFRSLFKGFTWRIVATLTIVIIAYIKTGDVTLAIEIGAIEFVVKYILYYLHERIWQSIPRGASRKFFKPNVKD